MAFDFPNTPTTNQIVTMPDGSVRRWDGTKWVAGQTPSVPYCTIGDTPPSSPVVGTTWWDSVSCQLFLYYNDGNSSQWVPAVAIPASIGEAPADGNYYARRSNAWSNIVIAPQVQANVGRNLLHNALYNVTQRGTGIFNPAVGNGGYTADRWGLYNAVTGDNSNCNVAAANDGHRSAIGDEAVQNFMYINVVGGAGATNCSTFYQPIENVRRLAGKTVTASFWAWTGAGTPRLGLNLQQNFGSGGSPSPAVALAGQAITLTTTPTRYAMTFAIPSAAGKTFGTTANTDFTTFQFWLSAGANYATNSGNIGVQTGVVIALWGVQVEIGSVATPLEKLDPRLDLANCQRFYQTGFMNITTYQSTGAGFGYTAPLPVVMRASPTVAYNLSTQTNATGSSISSYFAVGMTLFGGPTTATGTVVVQGTWTASADL